MVAFSKVKKNPRFILLQVNINRIVNKKKALNENEIPLRPEADKKEELEKWADKIFRLMFFNENEEEFQEILNLSKYDHSTIFNDLRITLMYGDDTL